MLTQLTSTGGGALAFSDQGNFFPVEFAPITAIRTDALSSLRDWFTRRSRDGKTLERSAFDVSELKGHMAILSLVNLVLQDGQVIDFKVRITGRSVEEVYGALPSDNARDHFPVPLFERWRSTMQRVVDHGAPIYSRSRTVVDASACRQSEVLLLPFTEKGEINQLMCGNVFGVVEPLSLPR